MILKNVIINYDTCVLEFEDREAIQFDISDLFWEPGGFKENAMFDGKRLNGEFLENFCCDLSLYISDDILDDGSFDEACDLVNEGVRIALGLSKEEYYGKAQALEEEENSSNEESEPNLVFIEKIDELEEKVYFEDTFMKVIVNGISLGSYDFGYTLDEIKETVEDEFGREEIFDMVMDADFYFSDEAFANDIELPVSIQDVTDIIFFEE